MDEIGFFMAIEPLLCDSDSVLVCPECEIGILHRNDSDYLICDMCDTEFTSNATQ